MCDFFSFPSPVYGRGQVFLGLLTAEANGGGGKQILENRVRGTSANALTPPSPTIPASRGGRGGSKKVIHGYYIISYNLLFYSQQTTLSRSALLRQCRREGPE